MLLLRLVPRSKQLARRSGLSCLPAATILSKRKGHSNVGVRLSRCGIVPGSSKPPSERMPTVKSRPHATWVLQAGTRLKTAQASTSKLHRCSRQSC